MIDSICYIDGKFISINEAKIPVTDLIITRGYGVFDTLRTYGGKPFRAEDHLRRLERSAFLIGLTLPRTRTEISQVIHEILSSNNYPEASIRIIVTGGESDDFFTPSDKPSLIVMATPLHTYQDDYYIKGAKVATAEIERYLPEAKTIDYTQGEVAMRLAKDHDTEIVEILCVDRNKKVTEGIASNVFAIFGNTLVTPGENILLGITRQVVLELAESLFKVEIRNLSMSEFLEANEIFITGSTKEIMPITAVDSAVVCGGCCGPNTKKLMDVFQDMTQRFALKEEG